MSARGNWGRGCGTGATVDGGMTLDGRRMRRDRAHGVKWYVFFLFLVDVALTFFVFSCPCVYFSVSVGSRDGHRYCHLLKCRSRTASKSPWSTCLPRMNRRDPRFLAKSKAPPLVAAAKIPTTAVDVVARRSLCWADCQIVTVTADPSCGTDRGGNGRQGSQVIGHEWWSTRFKVV